MRYIYGHSTFRGKADALDYLRNLLPFTHGGEHRTTYNCRLDAIIFSVDGEILGELVVGGIRDATEEDRQKYAKARTVYCITEIRLVRQTTLAQDIGICDYQYGKEVPDSAYEALKRKALGFEWIITHKTAGSETGPESI